MSKLFDRVTIILTLKGREDFTYRWMNYMDNKRCPYRILIADGGEDQKLENFLKSGDHYKNLKYSYLRYPFDATLSEFYSKLENVISLVESDYVLLADNDDFYILDRISELASFLDANSDYVAARGQLVTFEVFDSLGNSNACAFGARYRASMSHTKSIDSDNPVERIDSVCRGMAEQNYYMNWYSVVRTQALQKIWKNLVSLPIREIIVLEVMTHVMLLHEGKLKVIASPFYMRQLNTSFFGDDLVIDNKFLERCLCSNAFSEFPVAVNLFLGATNDEDRRKILISIAGWLNIFLFNINRGNQIRSGVIFKYYNFFIHVPYIGILIEKIFIFVKYFFNQGTKKTIVRIPDIEPYILNKS
jgi:glycosyltransferase domain-containing protein